MSLDHLSRLRQSGVKPSVVWLLVGDYQQIKWWGNPALDVEIVIPECVSRLDLRPVIGCSVIIMAERYTDGLMRLLDDLKGYAMEFSCYVMTWLPDDFCLRWKRGEEISAMFDQEAA